MRYYEAEVDGLEKLRTRRPLSPMASILIIGGTAFLGRSVAELALGRGLEVTLFNRGLTNPGLFPEAEHIRGDRDGDLDRLGRRDWDIVIDTCGYRPDVVRQSTRRLADRAGWYSFVSSLAVYADFSQVGLNEESATVAPIGEGYGPLKISCEQEVEEAFAARSTITRPGLIVGPGDPTGRFTYWPVRVGEGGDILAPGDPGMGVQFIDVRDLAAWILDSAERRAPGVFNAVGPEPPITMAAFLHTCALATNSDPTFVWCADDFLAAEGLVPYFTLPLWLDAGGALAGLAAADFSRASRAGLHLRPAMATVLDTFKWASRPGTLHAVPVWSRGEEARVLARWLARRESEGER